MFYSLLKFERNMQNDLENERKLRQLGYKVIVVWECEIKECFDYRMEELIKEIKESDI